MIDVSSKIAQARTHFESGRAEQAKAGLLRALQQTPGHPDLSNALALVLMGMGQAELALYHARRAAAGRPNDPGFLNNLGNSLALSGHKDEARRAFEQAVAIDPQSPFSRLGL